MDELRRRYQNADKEYAKRKKAAEKAVVRWEWAQKEDRNIEPLFFERLNLKRGKRMKTPPAHPKMFNTAYGLDGEDRVVVERGYVLNEAFTESFFAWTNSEVEWTRYSDMQSVSSVGKAKLEGGRITELCICNDEDTVTKTYTWEDGAITRISERWKSGGKNEVGPISLQKMQKDEKLQDLLPPLEKMLIAAIPERVRAMKVKEPAFSLIVAFAGEGNDMFPPTLGVGLVRERDAAQWNVADYEHYDTDVADAKMKLLAERVSRQIKRDGAWKAGYQAYDRIAKALRKLEWKKILKPSSDFVVIALDYDEKNLQKQLRDAKK
jgi:hypothetical protein